MKLNSILIRPPSQADSLSDTSFDSDAYAEGGGGSSTEVASREPSIGGGGGDGDLDEDSVERRKRNKTLVKATLNHNSIWASSVDVLDREERGMDDDETSGGSKSHPLVNLVSLLIHVSSSGLLWAWLKK